MNFELVILNGENSLNRYDDNVDVEITLVDNRVFSATFFTLKNIESLLSNYKTTGECASGLYFWAQDMIVVNDLDEITLRKTIIDLLDSEELYICCLVRAGLIGD